MKKLTFLFSFLLAGLWAMAQPYTVSISGTVTDPNGDPVENVQIALATDSLPGGVIYFNTVFTGPDGTYSDAFTTNSPWGIMYVTMINCALVPSETLFFAWQSGNASFTADFVYCDVSGNCAVDILVDSTAGGGNYLLTALPTGTAPYAYQWSTGETSASITSNGTGLFCVTVTDATGCEAETCVLLVDPQQCWVSIEADPAGGLTAWPQGAAPFTYLWSNGATTQSIFPNAPGEYCVVVADASGCTSQACYWFQPGGDTLCSVSIIAQQIPGTTGYNLSAWADGEPPFTFLWSTGATTDNINIFESGVYCVTVVDATGCASSACLAIQIQGSNYNISGYVYPADSTFFPPQLIGKVYLIQYDPSGGTLTAVDSVGFSNDPASGGYYSFDNVAAGNYLVKAFLTPGSPAYEDYLPTYHNSFLYWNEANEITVPNNFLRNIALIPGSNPGGPGFIGGLVSEGANIWGGGGADRGEGDPIPNISILLLNEQEEPVTHTLTHSDGTFGLENLAWGTYKVIVEIPGLQQGFKWVTIGPDNPSVNISFNVNEEGIVLAVKQINEEITSMAYPNPVLDQLSLYFFLEQSAKGQLNILTVDGKVMQTQSLQLQGGGQVVPVNVKDLKTGIYILQVTTDGWMVSHRVIKE